MRVRQPARLEALEYGVCEAVAPGPGEIRVQVQAASLNYRDGLIASGVFPARDGLVPLSDGAGAVVEVGAGVIDFQPGDAVISVFHPKWMDGHIDRADLDNSPGGPADGLACESLTRPTSHFTRAPRGLSAVEAATLPCAGVTAWRAVVADGAVKPGEHVLIQGTGGVSLFALQLAKAAGATVIAISSSADKLERLSALGADHLINRRQTENWGEAALALTGGRGVEHVIEVGGPHSIGQSFIAARTGGHVAIIGAVGGFDIDTMPFAIVQAKRLRLQAVTVGSRRDQIDLVRAVEAHGIKPVIDSCFPLDQLGVGLSRLMAGEHFGKICIQI